MDDKTAKIWTAYAKCVDNAEYLRVIEHKAHGEAEATERFNTRMAQAGEARDLALSIAAKQSA